MNRKGQATTEMVFMIPLLLSLIGGGLLIVYSCWQGIKVQQAANLAGRIQGQERVSGGKSETDIKDVNGVGVDPAMSAGDEDPTLSGTRDNYRRNGMVTPNSVYSRLRQVAYEMFGSASDNVYVPPPVIGQNVDRVKVVRVITLPKIPFLDSKDEKKQIILEGTAWGGEDTFMYGLPRWGKTDKNNSKDTVEWRNLVNDPSQDHD